VKTEDGPQYKAATTKLLTKRTTQIRRNTPIPSRCSWSARCLPPPTARSAECGVRNDAAAKAVDDELAATSGSLPGRSAVLEHGGWKRGELAARLPCVGRVAVDNRALTLPGGLALIGPRSRWEMAARRCFVRLGVGESRQSAVTLIAIRRGLARCCCACRLNAIPGPFRRRRSDADCHYGMILEVYQDRAL